MVRSNRGRDTGRDTRRAVGSWSHYLPSQGEAGNLLSLEDGVRELEFVQANSPSIYLSIYLYINAYMYIHVHMYKCTHLHIYIYIYTFTYVQIDI